MTGFQIAMAHVFERLRGRFGLLLCTIGIGWVALSAVLERIAMRAEAPTEVLLQPIFGVAVPLSIFSIVRRISGSRLNDVIDACALSGSSRRSVALGLSTGIAIAGMVCAVGLSSLGLILTHGLDGRALVGDLVTTDWIAALGATAYSCFFLSGAQLGPKGSGAIVFLGADWLLGSSASFAALPWPRAHVLNLLGGAAPLGMLAWQASSALAFLALFYLAILALRLAR